MGRVNLLLVDDEESFVETMTKRLTKRDLHVTAAFSGASALALLEGKEPIEVVVLDVKMPGMDGISTLREIKRMRPLVEVIMLTGHGTLESGIEGMKLGAFDYLTKPCDIDKLMAKIQEAAEAKSQREEKITQARIRDIELRRGD